MDETGEGSVPAGEPIRVVIVDDHPVWRDGIRSDLEASGVAVVGEAGDGGTSSAR
jgi:DNA-binding NarL/FixJ family response regulator